MKIQTKKIALFQNIELGYTTMVEEWAEKSDDYIRVSEYVEVEFKMVQKSDYIEDLVQINIQKRRILDEEKSNIMKEIISLKVQS
jgi:hypothetical protein